jgi:hypothetical protein
MRTDGSTTGRFSTRRYSNTCETCHEPFDARSWRTKRCDRCKVCRRCGKPAKRSAQFCGNRCDMLFRKEQGWFAAERSGANNPAWKGGRSAGYYRKAQAGTCERCGSRRFLLVHHRDRDRTNSDPSNLESLCKRCHQVEHGAGRHLRRTKLTEDQVRDIRARYDAGSANQTELAREYGVGHQNIWHIVRRKTWRNVT